MPPQSSKSKTFTALIADDHAILRSGIREVLQQLGIFDILDEACDGLEAIAKVRRHRPDLLMLDVAMPYAQGIGVYNEVRRWSPETKVVVFTGMTARGLLGELVRSGVDGLFMKNESAELLTDALPLIMHGAKVIPSPVLELLDDAPALALTGREKQVLSLIAMGNSNREIAEKLGVSFKTIDQHRTNLMRKLDVHSTAQLLAYALREGYLDPAQQT